MSKDAVIVSVARTPIGKAYRGAFNNLEAPSMMAHAIKHAVTRAGIDSAEIDDCIIGAALQQGTQSSNLGRIAAIAAGLPSSVSGMTIDRQCSSGLMSIATAAKQIVMDGSPIVVAGGCESISLVQNEHMNITRIIDPLAIANSPDIYMGMLDTAELVANRYNISREAQDEYAAQSQQRTAAGQAAGKFDDEIVALTATKLVADRETGAISDEQVTLSKDEGNRPSTNVEGLA
ncbi:MAG: acetyl-CoA C-acyltransferase, partial [Pseudomonadales bacterium]